jgi:Undecaprenyl-phosphate galactose phosphotransferase WbaP
VEVHVASVTAIPSELGFQLVRIPKMRCKPLASCLVILACDLLAIVASACIMFWAKRAAGGVLDAARYLGLWPALGIFVTTFAALRLYPGVIHNAVTELRRIALGLTISFLALAAFIFMTRGAANYSRQIFLVCWLVAMCVTPLLRTIARGLLARQPWWGVPVVIFYTGDESGEILRQLESHPELGLKPTAILSRSGAGRFRHHLPVLDVRHAAAVRASGVERAIIALPDGGSSKLLQDLENFESLFPRLMIMHSSTALYTLSVEAQDIGGALTMEVRKNLLFPVPRITKRTIDLALVLLSFPLALLTVLLLAVLVKFDSPGPVFYGHRRIGRDNSTFRAWKIRTMLMNSDEILRDTLAQDHALSEEWRRDRKLKRDPRVTRLGRVLRRTSLDELPQLWNVLRGEMSLVGPRPIIEEEVSMYGHHFPLYCRVTPGLTGLWQVSGRSSVSVPDRVRLDSYYVRNWSPWLDLHILARTPRAVVSGQGAY